MKSILLHCLALLLVLNADGFAAPPARGSNLKLFNCLVDSFLLELYQHECPGNICALLDAAQGHEASGVDFSRARVIYAWRQNGAIQIYGARAKYRSWPFHVFLEYGGRAYDLESNDASHGMALRPYLETMYLPSRGNADVRQNGWKYNDRLVRENVHLMAVPAVDYLREFGRLSSSGNHVDHDYYIHSPEAQSRYGSTSMGAALENGLPGSPRSGRVSRGVESNPEPRVTVVEDLDHGKLATWRDGNVTVTMDPVTGRISVTKDPREEIHDPKRIQEFLTAVKTLSASNPSLKAILDEYQRKPEVIPLFDKNGPVENYDQSVARVRPGDTVQFSDGTRYRVHEIVSHGATLILDLGDGWLVRVPGYHDPTGHFVDGVPFIRDFQEMQPELERNGVPVVEMDAKRGVLDEAAVVKKIPIVCNLEDFLLGNDRAGEKFSKSEIKKIEKKLLKFARKTWMYTYIGDFDPTQLVYDGKKWILIDTALNNGDVPSGLIENLNEPRNIFTHLSAEDPQRGKPTKDQPMYDSLRIKYRVFKEIDQTISDERNAQKRNPKVLRRIQKAGTYTRKPDPEDGDEN